MSQAGRLVEMTAKLGYAARGMVYVAVGWAAARAAIGWDRVTDPQGALADLPDRPAGQLLLGLLALGLAAYALWRAVEALLDPDGNGTGAKGLAIRIGQGFSAFVYAALAYGALEVLRGTGDGGSGDGSMREWTALLLDLPAGRALVALAGAAVLGTAAAHAVKAWKAGFQRHLPDDADVRRVMVPVGRAGLAARGIVFAVTGGFLLMAAWHADADRSGGQAAALRTLADQPFGAWLLGVVALGLIAFGIYSLAMGHYRTFPAARAEAKLRAAL
ncbi:MAG TPA: DUF1206 domain-containing protein [Azospirillaceae bacterium]|nr:DUF1206 domain-containing protein [Azospirillaceae bacterium]